jgi:hypothetical protein
LRKKETLTHRPAASVEVLEGFAKKVRLMAERLDPGDELGCSVCGRGSHVDGCPVPALWLAEAKLRTMATVPVASDVRTRGTSAEEVA